MLSRLVCEVVQDGGVSTEQPTPPRRSVFPSAVPVWILVAVGALLVGLISPTSHYLSWLPIVLAVGVLITFCVQLAIVEKEGLVSRVIVTLAGSVIILAAASAVLGLIALRSA